MVEGGDTYTDQKGDREQEEKKKIFFLFFITLDLIPSIGVFILNPILSDLAILCKFGL